MFVKIFKHAFLRPLKTVLSLIAVSLIAGILAGFCQMMGKRADSDHLIKVFRSLSSLSTFAISILAFAQITVVYTSFHKAVATDEAYFTYTLPATTGQQVGARYLSLLVWNTISLVGFILSYFLMALFTVKFSVSDGGVESPPMRLNEIILMMEIIILVGISYLSVVSHVQFGIVFANALSLKLKRKLSSFLVGLIFFLEFVILVITFILSLDWVIGKAILGIDFIHLLLWILILLIGGLGSLAYFLTYKFMGRWLNVA